MTNSREGRAVIRLQYDFSLNDKALGWGAVVSDCTTPEYSTSFFLFFFLHLSDYTAATVDLELDLTPPWESAYPCQSLMSRFLSAVESHPATGASRNDYFHCLINPSVVRQFSYIFGPKCFPKPEMTPLFCLQPKDFHILEDVYFLYSSDLKKITQTDLSVIQIPGEKFRQLSPGLINVDGNKTNWSQTSFQGSSKKRCHRYSVETSTRICSESISH